VPKRNYGFEKRQKELNRRQKKEEKLQRRQERNKAESPESDLETAPEAPGAHQSLDEAGEPES
jgi:hypothetical protein